MVLKACSYKYVSLWKLCPIYVGGGGATFDMVAYDIFKTVLAALTWVGGRGEYQRAQIGIECEEGFLLFLVAVTALSGTGSTP